MTKIKYIFFCIYKTLLQRKTNTIIAITLLTISIVCSFFTISVGYNNAKEISKNDIKARNMCFEIDCDSSNGIISLFDELNKSYQLKSFVIVGSSNIQKNTYTTIGEQNQIFDINVGTEMMNSKNNFMSDFGNAEFNKDSDVVISTGLANDLDMKIASKSLLLINGQEYNVIGSATHKVFSSFALNKYPPSIFIKDENFDKAVTGFKEVCILFSDSLTEQETEEIIRTVEKHISPVDSILPIVDKRPKIEKNQMFITISLLVLAFVNVYSVFLFIAKKRKAEFITYRIYGAGKKYVFADMFMLISVLSTISIIIGVLIYLLLSPLLKSIQMYYPLKLYSFLITFIIIFLLDFLSAFLTVREVTK